MFKILSICKGGGYRYCRTEPPHPKRNSKGLYPLHRVLLENKLGRLLNDDEEAHHTDENKSNDSPDNIELKTKSEHAKYHKDKNAPKMIELKCMCGNVIKLKPYEARHRKSRNKSGKIYCSIACSGKFTNKYFCSIIRDVGSP